MKSIVINKCEAKYDETKDKGVNSAKVFDAVWTATEVTSTDQLQDLLEKYTHSLTIWDDKKEDANCRTSYGVMVDIDNKERTLISFEDAKSILKKENIESYIYSSKSYKPQVAEKFHIVIPFEKPFNFKSETDWEKYSKIYSYFVGLFRGEADAACANPSRHFFASNGNPQKYFLGIEGERFDWRSYEKLDTTPYDKGSNINDRTIAMDMEVTLKNKKKAKICDLENKGKAIPCYCNFCDDKTNGRNDSAFVGFDKRGLPFMYCKSCEANKRKPKYVLPSNEANEILTRANGFRVFQLDGSTEYNYILPSRRISNNSVDVVASLARKYGTFIPTEREIYRPCYDFSTDDLIIDCPDDIPFINQYKAPEVLSSPADPGIGPDKFPCTWDTLCNLIPVEEERDKYLQWLSNVVNRKRNRTAFLFLGAQGTGKTVWATEIIGNMIGYIVTVTREMLLSKFNNWLEDGIFYLFEEVSVNAEERNSVNTKLKPIITNEHVAIEGKHINCKQNYRLTGNCMFCSNEELPLEVEGSDRRFSVVRTSSKRLDSFPWYTSTDIYDNVFKAELPYFVAYLKSIKIDRAAFDPANQTIENDEKKRLQISILTDEQKFWKYLEERDEAGFQALQDDVVSSWDIRVEINSETNSIQSKLEKWHQDGYISVDSLRAFLKNIFHDKKKHHVSLDRPLHGFYKSKIRDDNTKKTQNVLRNRRWEVACNFQQDSCNLRETATKDKLRS